MTGHNHKRFVVNMTTRRLSRAEAYSVGYDETTANFFRARRASTHAAFLLPPVG